MSRTTQYKTGLDEVGRGPIAGPITVGCVALPTKYTWTYFKKLHTAGSVPPLRDSKKLTEKQRKLWYLWITKQTDIMWSVASVSAAQIDKMGIVKAGNTAATNALKGASRTANVRRLDLPTFAVSLDRGLMLPADIEQTSYTKGDERFVEIALASIMAKVTRDRYMCRLDKVHKMYSFASNKGYGSKAHYTALKSHGLTKMHRKSFVHCA
jgi:ribonuclease HII